MLKVFSYLIKKKPIQRRCSIYTKIHQKNKQKGQVLLEYILLIIIVVTIARALMEGLVLRSPGNEGIVIKTWMQVSQTIAEDLADEP